MKPSFVGIGVQKCATTWLHQILASHPQVSVPAVKEANFFSYRFDHGYQWYERLFDAGDPGCRLGEVSPSYFYDAAVPERVRAYHPDIKILLALRDPVQRAMSNHRHEVRLGHIVGHDLSFEAGLANNPMYVEQGLYAKHLANWLKCFPRHQIFIVLFDDIERDPEGVARDVFHFLQIDKNIAPAAITKRFNQSLTSRVELLFRAKERLYDVTRAPGLAWLWSAASVLGLRKLYRKTNIAGPDTPVPSMSVATERALRLRFLPDIEELEPILGRSLSHWKSGNEAIRPERHGIVSASEVEQWATR